MGLIINLLDNEFSKQLFLKTKILDFYCEEIDKRLLSHKELTNFLIFYIDLLYNISDNYHLLSKTRVI